MGPPIVSPLTRSCAKENPNIADHTPPYRSAAMAGPRATPVSVLLAIASFFFAFLEAWDISIGAVETELLQQMSAETVATMIGKSPLKRLGTVDELAELVAWLASERCSFSTGAVFDLSGGRATY